MSINEAFRWLREKRDLTQAQVVKPRTSLGKNQPGRIESGSSLPRFETVYSYLDGLGATLGERHHFAHIAFDLEFPLGREPEDPLIVEICDYLKRLPNDVIYGMLLMLRLLGGGATEKPRDTRSGFS